MTLFGVPAQLFVFGTQYTSPRYVLAAVFKGRGYLTADEARRLASGGRLAAAASIDRPGTDPRGSTDPQAPTAAYGPDGALIALVTEESGQARPLVVFA